MSQFLAPALREGDEEVEQSLRPRRLDEFIGQERTKEQLEIALEAAKGRGEALDHVLLVGPPGLGKTTLAAIIREELDVGIRTVAGPALGYQLDESFRDRLIAHVRALLARGLAPAGDSR